MIFLQAQGVPQVGGAHLYGGWRRPASSPATSSAEETPPHADDGQSSRPRIRPTPSAPPPGTRRGRTARRCGWPGWGCFVFRSIRIPSRVLMRQMPSAPSASQARAISAMSVTLGESFMKTGFFVTALTARVTSAAASGSEPKFLAASVDVGTGDVYLQNAHLVHSRPASRQFSVYSSTEKPPTLAMTRPVKDALQCGAPPLR